MSHRLVPHAAAKKRSRLRQIQVGVQLRTPPRLAQHSTKQHKQQHEQQCGAKHPNQRVGPLLTVAMVVAVPVMAVVVAVAVGAARTAVSPAIRASAGAAVRATVRASAVRAAVRASAAGDAATAIIGRHQTCAAVNTSDMVCVRDLAMSHAIHAGATIECGAEAACAGRAARGAWCGRRSIRAHLTSPTLHIQELPNRASLARVTIRINQLAGGACCGRAVPCGWAVHTNARVVGGASGGTAHSWHIGDCGRSVVTTHGVKQQVRVCATRLGTCRVRLLISSVELCNATCTPLQSITK